MILVCSGIAVIIGFLRIMGRPHNHYRCGTLILVEVVLTLLYLLYNYEIICTGIADN